MSCDNKFKYRRMNKLSKLLIDGHHNYKTYYLLFGFTIGVNDNLALWMKNEFLMYKKHFENPKFETIDIDKRLPKNKKIKKQKVLKESDEKEEKVSSGNITDELTNSNIYGLIYLLNIREGIYKIGMTKLNLYDKIEIGRLLSYPPGTRIILIQYVNIQKVHQIEKNIVDELLKSFKICNGTREYFISDKSKENIIKKIVFDESNKD